MSKLKINEEKIDKLANLAIKEVLVSKKDKIF